MSDDKEQSSTSGILREIAIAFERVVADAYEAKRIVAGEGGDE